MNRLGAVATKVAAMAFALAAAEGCGPTPRRGEGSTGETPPRGARSPSSETAQEGIQRLEREVRALALPGGCQSSGECRAAPVGDRPCGGPRTYVVYCARTTDSVALYRKLDELARAERAHNQEQGLASTCEFRTPPAVTAESGSCRAAAP
jgi:hypothetical protein